MFQYAFLSLKLCTCQIHRRMLQYIDLIITTSPISDILHFLNVCSNFLVAINREIFALVL